MEISPSVTRPNNWKLILSMLLAGPQKGSTLRQALYETRYGEEWDSRRHRGFYIWYFSSAPHRLAAPLGLDYGYIRRVTRGVYEITDTGREYLRSSDPRAYLPNHRSS